MASQDWLEKDFYQTLGVAKDVSEADLKKVYRKLARKYHPDSNPGDAQAEAKFKEISEAYSVLSDPKQRQEYDQIRAMGSGARFSAGTGGGTRGFEDLFGGMFGGGGNQRVRFTTGGGGAGYEDLLGGMFGGGGFGGPTPGRDVTARATISFAQAIDGTTVSLATASGRTVKTKIPAGVKDGQKIKLRGKGEPSPNGGPAGDMIITVHVAEHPVFSRDGDNLRVTVPVSFAEAAMGATIEVPTWGGGRVKVRVPAGTPSGRTLRVRGKGVASKKRTGDLLVTIEVAVPKNLSKDAQAAVEAFATATAGDDPREDLWRHASEK